jgi:hypothetical protein
MARSALFESIVASRGLLKKSLCFLMAIRLHVQPFETVMDNSVTVFPTWYEGRRVRSAYRESIDNTIASNYPNERWCDVTFTLKQGTRMNGCLVKLNRDIASRTLSEFLRRLNKKIYGNAYRRHKKRLACVPVIETGKVGGRLHIHMALQVPDYMKDDLHRFFDIVEQEWKKSEWARWGSMLRPISSEKNRQWWTNYLFKDVSADDEVFDVQNFHLGSHLH